MEGGEQFFDLAVVEDGAGHAGEGDLIIRGADTFAIGHDPQLLQDLRLDKLKQLL
jgi:hypothetical protein